MVVWCQRRMKPRRIAGDQYLSKQRKRLVRAWRVAHHLFVGTAPITLVIAMVPLIYRHDLGQLRRQGRALFGVCGAAEIGIFERQVSGKIVLGRTAEPSRDVKSLAGPGVARPLDIPVIIYLWNPFGVLLLRGRELYRVVAQFRRRCCRP